VAALEDGLRLIQLMFYMFSSIYSTLFFESDKAIQAYFL
jgi:hypothetical protein